VCLAAISLLFTELTWRALGYVPAGSDILQFVRLRQSIARDPEVVALVGSSRVRCGLDPETMNRSLRTVRFVQLGILGNSGMPVLEDLAEDESFRGSIVCEFQVSHWSADYPFSRVPEPLAYMHPKLSGSYVETALGERLREYFCFYNFNLLTELPRSVQGKPPASPELPSRFDPYQWFSAELDNVLMRRWVELARDSAGRINHSQDSPMARKILYWVEKIRRRGGDVAFVHMPVDGALRQTEDRLFPQAKGMISNLRTHGLVVDYSEMPQHFRCPDGSHLAVEDAERFSRVLVETLAASGFFRQKAK
jgi:hypothetical protein